MQEWLVAVSLQIRRGRFCGSIASGELHGTRVLAESLQATPACRTAIAAYERLPCAGRGLGYGGWPRKMTDPSGAPVSSAATRFCWPQHRGSPLAAPTHTDMQPTGNSAGMFGVSLGEQGPKVLASRADGTSWSTATHTWKLCTTLGGTTRQRSVHAQGERTSGKKLCGMREGPEASPRVSCEAVRRRRDCGAVLGPTSAGSFSHAQAPIMNIYVRSP